MNLDHIGQLARDIFLRRVEQSKGLTVDYIVDQSFADAECFFEAVEARTSKPKRSRKAETKDAE